MAAGDERKARGGRGGRANGASAPERRTVGYGEYSIIRIEFSPTEREDFAHSFNESGGAGLDIDRLLLDGYSLKLRSGDDGKTVLISLTQHYTDHQNAGLTLVARAGDSATALAVLAYKLEIVGGRPWREAEHDRGGVYRHPDIG